ncbi:hypothetical protein BC940DRAFT_299666 [Gongronella butleri]|nr:hypothetical protein BC940DRAFT_299666 [Gongronella butleri]
MSHLRKKKPVQYFFVDINDPDYYKRIKVTRACVSCRKRKSKCDLGVPGTGSCSNCIKYNKQCEFDAPVKPLLKTDICIPPVVAMPSPYDEDSMYGHEPTSHYEELAATTDGMAMPAAANGHHHHHHHHSHHHHYHEHHEHHQHHQHHQHDRYTNHLNDHHQHQDLPLPTPPLEGDIDWLPDQHQQSRLLPIFAIATPAYDYQSPMIDEAGIDRMDEPFKEHPPRPPPPHGATAAFYHCLDQQLTPPTMASCTAFTLPIHDLSIDLRVSVVEKPSEPSHDPVYYVHPCRKSSPDPPVFDFVFDSFDC